MAASLFQPDTVPQIISETLHGNRFPMLYSHNKRLTAPQSLKTVQDLSSPTRRRPEKKEKKKWVWIDTILVSSGRLNVSLNLLEKLHGKRDLSVVLFQPIITSYVRVNQACFRRAFAKRFDDNSSSNIVAFRAS
eukprot:1136610-Pelagomonas_calceolata.AAC.1